MKRYALASLVLSLLAGTAAAQNGPSYDSYRSTPPTSSVVILKAVITEEAEVPASAYSSVASLGKPQEEQRHELSKCGKCGQAWTDCCCDAGCGWMIFGEWMLLQPRGSDAVFATRALNCAGPPIGVEEIDLAWFDSFRVGFHRQCGDCSEIGASFWMFESEENERANPTVGADVLFPALLFPTIRNIDPGCNDATSTTARASLGIDFDRVNIDYRSRFDCHCIEFDWLVGFGYGKLEQDLTAIYDEGFVRTDTDLHGYGIRVGGGATYGLGCFRGFVHTDLTLLAANLEARYRNIDTFDGEVADFEQHLDRIVPILDLEVGIAYDLTRHTTVKVGYIYSIWWNVVTTPSFIEDVQKGDITGDSDDTLTFDGVFARIEINF